MRCCPHFRDQPPVCLYRVSTSAWASAGNEVHHGCVASRIPLLHLSLWLWCHYSFHTAERPAHSDLLFIKVHQGKFNFLSEVVLWRWASHPRAWRYVLYIVLYSMWSVTVWEATGLMMKCEKAVFYLFSFKDFSLGFVIFYPNYFTVKAWPLTGVTVKKTIDLLIEYTGWNTKKGNFYW